MAATTVDRNTPALMIERQIVLKLETTADIPAGAIVCTNAAGNAVNGSDTAALVCQGRAAHRATYANGDREIVVERGVFVYANDGNVVQASVGTLVTILDNQTVSTAAITTNDIGAGYCDQIVPEGVVVSMLGGKIAAA
jgi:hypothetical protein